MAVNHNMVNDYTKMSFSKLCIYYIYFMLIYLCFETPILNLTPSFLLVFVRYGIEAFGYVLLLLLIIAQWGHFKFENPEIIIFSCLLLVAVNVVLYVANIKIAALGFRWLFRYLYIYFLVIMINWPKFYIRRFFHLLTWIIRIEGVIAILQFAARDWIEPFLIPTYSDIIEGISSYSTYRSASKALFGTFGRYSEFGFFVMLALWFFISGFAVADNVKRKRQCLNGIIIWSGILVFSYCRQALVGIIISVLIFLIAFRECRMTRSSMAFVTFLILISIPISIVLLSDFEATYGTVYESVSKRYLSIFSLNYLAMDYTGKGRTWFYTEGLYRLLSHRPILGFGLGLYGCQTAIQYDPSVYEALDIPTSYSMDVYYVSIIGQLGLVGAAGLINVYRYFARWCRIYFNQLKTDLYRRQMAVMTYGYVICGLITAFFSSSLSDRYLNFYVWILLGMCRYCKANDLVFDNED